MSSRISESSQHVGRIVDPDVRDDGGLEPIVEFGAPAPGPEPVTESEPAPPAVATPSPGLVNSVSEPAADVPFAVKPTEPTLTAPFVAPAFTPLPPGVKSMPNAAELTPFEEAKSPSSVRPPEVVPPPPKSNPRLDFEGLSDDDHASRHSRDLELDRVGAGLLSQPRGNLAHESSRTALSPNLFAFFGAITGMLTVATIIAIAMRLDHSPALPRQVTQAPVASTQPLVSVAEEPAQPPKTRQRNKIPGPYRVKDSSTDPALRVVEGHIGFDPFLKAVEKAGMPLKEAYRVLKAFEKLRPLGNCAKSDKFAFALERGSNKVKAFEYIAGPDDIFQAREGKDGLLGVEKLDLKVQREQVTGAFVVADSGLERSVVNGGFEPALLRAMREAMTGHASLDELERGARVRVIAQEVTALGEFARYAGIEALEIQFAANRKPLRIYYFDGPKSRGYFDETARAPFEGGWRNPIPNAPITSKFNMKRMHPVLHKIMPHTGMDFGAAMGVPVGACSFGTISFMGWGGPSGNLVKVQHSDDIETGYAHLSRFAEGLKVGDKVTRLQTVGYVGSTGRSTGPHLHFTVKRKGGFIDPETLKLDALRVLPSDERAVFMQHKAQYDAKLEAIALPALPNAMPSAPSNRTQPEGEEDEMGEAAAPGASSVPSAGASPAAPPGAPNPGQARTSGPSLYLTDEELLRQQKASDNGEVDE